MLVRSRERGAVGEAAPDGVLAADAIDRVPLVELHRDPPQHERRPALQATRGRRTSPRPPRRSRPCPAGVRGAIHLAKEVAHRHAVRVGTVGPAEAVLAPPQRREGPRVLEEHAQRVGDGAWLVGRDDEQRVATRPLVLELVDRERGQRREPVGLGAARAVDEAGPEAHRHGEPGRRRGELGFDVRERRAALGEPRRIVGDQPHPRGEALAVHPAEQIEGDERRERTRSRGDAGLVLAVERDDALAVDPFVVGARGGAWDRPPPVECDARRARGEGAGPRRGARGEEPAPRRPGSDGIGRHLVVCRWGSLSPPCSRMPTCSVRRSCPCRRREPCSCRRPSSSRHRTRSRR